MAKRLVFIPIAEKPFYKEVEIEFEFYSGFSKQQKIKSINSLHNEIHAQALCNNILEVSTNSSELLGSSLSAFNLKLWNNESDSYISIENIFQSAKKIQHGGPYLDLLKVFPWKAKKDEKLWNSGELVSFQINNLNYPLEPKSSFYDWLYINALIENASLTKELFKYDGFTDIEFNHNKSYSCQARSVAIYIGLVQSSNLETTICNFDVISIIYNSASNIYNATKEVKTSESQLDFFYLI